MTIITMMILSKDARLPEQLQRAMAAEAEAAREARAKVIVKILMTIMKMIINMTTLMMHHETPETPMMKKTSKVIAAEGEHKASRALRHAAEVIAESPSALQVIS